MALAMQTNYDLWRARQHMQPVVRRLYMLRDVAIEQKCRQSSLMSFRRPIVPSHIPELAGFGVAALGVLFVTAYAFWAASRELIAWHEVPALTILMGLGSLPMVAMGLWLRRQRLKKTAELQNYECILAAAHDPR